MEYGERPDVPGRLTDGLLGKGVDMTKRVQVNECVAERKPELMCGLVFTVRAILLPSSFTRIPREPLTFNQEIFMELAVPPTVMLIGWVIHMLMLRGGM